jgi:dTDP-4-amino-4,6-dideoxygalactose transaminase
MGNDISVPILRIPFKENERKQLHDDLDTILDSGMLSQGEYTRAFERDFSSFVGSDYAIACSSGTSALELAFRGLGIKGKSVIIPTNTFMATAFAAIHAGNRVIFADSNPETFGLDPVDVRDRLEEDTAAVVLVHIGGIISDAIDEIKRICEEHELALIEDAAHAHGSKLNGRHAGTLGDVGAFSFYPTKVLTTGEGGMVTTNDDELASRIRQIRNHGKDPAQDNSITAVGYNWRMSELTAALGLNQLSHAELKISSRQQIASFYDDRLESIPGLEPLELPSELTSSYYKYIVIVADDIKPDELKRKMQADHNVSLTGEVYTDLCHDEPLWKDFTRCGRRRSSAEGVLDCSMYPECGCDDLEAESFDGAERIMNSHVCLPIYPGLSSGEVTHVVDSLESTIADLLEAS